MGLTDGGVAFNDEEWAEVEQDLPKLEDPFLKKYLDGREALIAEEHKRRSGARLISPSRRRWPT